MQLRIVSLLAVLEAIGSQASENKTSLAKSQRKKLVCYYTNWSQYRPAPFKFKPEDIPADLCTHIIYAFAKFDNELNFTTSEINDEEMYKRLMNLKKKNSNLKILLALSDSSLSETGYKTLFGNDRKNVISTFYQVFRSNVTSHIVSFLRQHQFDGLDINCVSRKGPDDKRSLAAFVNELLEAFETEAETSKKERLLLSATISGSYQKILDDYDVPALATHVDFINVKAFDLLDRLDNVTRHHAPLYLEDTESKNNNQLSVDEAAKLLVEQGAPKEKLIIGMPMFGRSFTLANLNSNRLNAPVLGAGKAGTYTNYTGVLAYYEICNMIRNASVYLWNDVMKVPFLVQGNQWIGFDDEVSIRIKMDWLKNNDYGGAMAWTLDFDDFAGKMCIEGIKYPLIGIMRKELLGIPIGEWTTQEANNQTVAVTNAIS